MGTTKRTCQIQQPFSTFGPVHCTSKVEKEVPSTSRQCLEYYNLKVVLEVYTCYA